MIYFDNAATTYPKPKSVIASTVDAINNYSFNSGRGGYTKCVFAAQKIYETREKIADTFGFEPQNIAFTNNCTTALNTAINGIATQGCHILISSIEHNSVSRTVHRLKLLGVADYDIVPYSTDDEQFIKNIDSMIKPNTTMVAMTNASNVFGVTINAKAVGEYCKSKGIYYVVDAAQSAGVLDIDGKEMNISALCAPGHKGLYGMMGTGFIAVQDQVNINSLSVGGTGSNSYDLVQPDFMPDRLEAGTLNNSGIASVGAGLDFVNSKGINNINKHEMALIEYIYDEMNKDKDITLYVDKQNMNIPVLSFNVCDYSSEHTAALLSQMDIATRAGFHCAPLAHDTFQSDQRGTVRISPSAFSTKKECEYLLKCIKKIE